MFLLALTRRPVRLADSDLTLRHLDAGAFVLTAATDGLRSSCVVESPRVLVSERIPGLPLDAAIASLAEAEYDGASGTLEVRKATAASCSLYYWIADGEFYCATHIRLLRSAGVPIEEDAARVPELLALQFVGAPATPFKGVQQLMVGGRLRLRVTAGGCTVEHVDCYQPALAEAAGMDLEAASGQVLAGLEEAIGALSPVRDRTTVLLSGGLDSSLMCRLAQRTLGTATTYSTGYPFEDPDANGEREYALSAAEALNSQHRYFEPTTEQYLRGLVEATAALEEPVDLMQTVLLHLLFSRGLPDDADIVISGEGADTLFGQDLQLFLYRLHHRALLRPFKRGPLRAALALATRVSGRGQLTADYLARSSDAELEDPDNMLWLFGTPYMRRWVSRHFAVPERELMANRLQAAARFAGFSVWELMSLLTLVHEEAATKTFWGKLATAAGRNTVAPFGQRRVQDTAYAIPLALKMRSLKHVVRSVARAVELPELIITRPKLAFDVHARRWVLPGGVIEPLIRLAEPAFDGEVMRGLQTGDPADARMLWSIISYAVWRRMWIEQVPEDSLLAELGDFLPRAPQGSA